MTPKNPLVSTWLLTPKANRAAAHFYVWWGKISHRLSFIFALQRYRPSPFYAFDEVDVFFRWGKCRAIS